MIQDADNTAELEAKIKDHVKKVRTAPWCIDNLCSRCSEHAAAATGA
jgi:hypothetical protein